MAGIFTGIALILLIVGILGIVIGISWGTAYFLDVKFVPKPSPKTMWVLILGGLGLAWFARLFL